LRQVLLFRRRYSSPRCTQPIATLDGMMPAGASGPTSVRALRWMFVTGRYHNRFRAVAARLLGSRS